MFGEPMMPCAPHRLIGQVTLPHRLEETAVIEVHQRAAMLKIGAKLAKDWIKIISRREAGREFFQISLAQAVAGDCQQCQDRAHEFGIEFLLQALDDLVEDGRDRVSFAGKLANPPVEEFERSKPPQFLQRDEEIQRI